MNIRKSYKSTKLQIQALYPKVSSFIMFSSYLRVVLYKYLFYFSVFFFFCFFFSLKKLSIKTRRRPLQSLFLPVHLKTLFFIHPNPMFGLVRAYKDCPENKLAWFILYSMIRSFYSKLLFHFQVRHVPDRRSG